MNIESKLKELTNVQDSITHLNENYKPGMKEYQEARKEMERLQRERAAIIAGIVHDWNQHVELLELVACSLERFVPEQVWARSLQVSVSGVVEKARVE